MLQLLVQRSRKAAQLLLPLHVCKDDVANLHDWEGSSVPCINDEYHHTKKSILHQRDPLALVQHVPQA